MIITIGWWVIPLLITIVSFTCVAFIKARTIDYTGIDSLILGGISLILSLISWLIYFIIF